MPYIDHDAAVYAAVREVISPHIVDMKIILATDKAAELFGFRKRHDIIGSYVSMLHHPDDISNTRRWALLRHRGYEAPQEYHIRIQRSDGMELAVNKRVNLVSLGTTNVSISEQHEVRREQFRPLTPPPPRIIDPDEMRNLWGIANLREADLFLRGHFNLTFGDFVDNFIPSMDTIIPKMEASVLDMNEAIQKLDLNSDAAYYRYKCLVCDREWISSVRLKPGEQVTHPRRCNFDDCRTTLWHDPAGAAYARAKRHRSKKRPSK